MVTPVLSQTVNRAEYFFDSDPGPGNATPITVSSPGPTTTFTTAISTSSLAKGFHFLCVRVQQSDGFWSSFEARGFYISQATTASTDLSAAEYFFDSDPGQGSATSIPVTPGATMSFTVSLPATSLAPGFHFLAIRTRDNTGRWSIFESRGFYVSGATTATPNIVDAEYFFDADPGTGSGIPITVPSGSTSNFTVSLPAASLAPGFHFLAIRVKNANGQWGLFESRGFYIAESIGNTSDIVAAEFFIDSDPGAGLGTPLNVSPPGATINQNYIVNVPASVPVGAHTLYIRVQNSEGVWSIYESAVFTIIKNDPPVAQAGTDKSITLPINSVSLDGSLSADTDGTIDGFLWTKVSGPVGENILTPINSTTLVENLSEGVYEFALRVTDNEGFIDRDTIQVTVNPEPNEIPVADAGQDQVIVFPATSVVLSGSGSTDADGTIVSYEWIKSTGPSGGLVADADNVSTEVTGLIPGVYVYQLTVTDNRGATDTDVVQISVNDSGCPSQPVITQIDDRLVCNPPGDSYQWLLNGEPIADQTQQLLQINLIEYGSYSVTLTDNNCSMTSDDFMYLVTDAENQADMVELFPNPVHGAFWIKINGKLPAKVNVIDRLGRTVYETQTSMALSEVVVSDLSSGIYFVVVGNRWYKIQKH